MPTQARFPDPLVASFDAAKIVGVRAGSEHRYTGIWVVVVDGRVFVRSWNDKPTGWFRAFLAQPRGSVQLGRDEIAVRAVKPRSARILDDVSAAYARKYDTKASQKWVTGFAEPERVRNTLELLPE